MNRRHFIGSIPALASCLLAGGAWAATRPLEIAMYADCAGFEEQLAELAARLEALDPAESLFCGIRSDIELCLAVRSDELIRLDGCTAAGANKVLVKIKLGPKLENHLTTLRAVQGDIFRHGGLRG